MGKIAHVVLSLDAGGLERVVAELCRYERSHGREVAVVCVQSPGVLAEPMRQAGVWVVCTGKRPGIDWELTRRLRDELRLIQPRVLHTHQIGALFYAGPAARRLGIPVVHTEHGKHYYSRFRTRLVARWALRSADRVCAVSDDTADAMRAHRLTGRQSITVVPNGISTADFARPPDDLAELRRSLELPAGVPVVGTIGRLTEVKQPDVLLRAFARLRRQMDARLVFVGDGPLRNSLGELAAELGVTALTRFVGYQERPQDFLHLFDVFALPSRSEGMPLAVLEAWAAGKPVVASRVGGLPRLIDDGVTGVLVESGNDEALAVALSRLLRDRAMGEAGRAVAVSRYDTAVMAEKYTQVYVEVISERGASAPRVSADSNRKITEN